MKIYSLEIVNFKSYLGQHIIGPFDDHFTCIIGPNGNGKSNILDAMLFVFGFKSSKLRQDSLASLIHSSAYGTPDEAKVSVTFISSQQNEQSFFTTVSRTIRKNNNSFYQLNERRIQWNELRQFLLKQCIDLQKNLFIILQGEVQRLCELSPQKLGQYMEYVSGSDQYLERITKLQTDYIGGGIEMERIKQSYGVMKKVYCQQEKEGFELLDHIRVRIQLVELGVLGYKKAQIQGKQRLQEYRKQLDITKEELTKIQQTLQQSNNELTKLKASILTNTNTMINYDKDISSINDQILRIQSQEIKKTTSEIEYLIRDIRQKQKEIEIVQREKNQVTEILETEGELREKADQAQKLLQSVIRIQKGNEKTSNQNEIGKIQKKNNKIKNQEKLNNQHHQEQSNRRLRNRDNTSHNKIQQFSPSNSNALGQQYIQLRNIHKLQVLISKSKLQIDSQFQQPLQSKQLNLKLLKETLSELVNKYTPTGELYKSPQQLITAAKIKLRQLVDSQQKRQKEIALIAQSLQEINNRISQKQTQKTFMTLSQKIIYEIKTANKYNILLPGKKIITLREVIHIPLEHQQYINPITPQLDWIVVENHNDAREIVNFLTTKKLGRMSLILMDEVKKIMAGVSTEYKGEQPKGCVRMIDVVKALQNQHEKILFWAMGNTLIADTLDDGVKAAYHTNPPHRVICKNGVFIDLSGTMTKVPLQSMAQQDRSLLDTRQKVLQRKLQQETKKLSLIRQQKQQSTKDLHELINSTNMSTNKVNNFHRQQFTTKQQLLQFMKSLRQEISQLQNDIITIKGNKATHELDIKLKDKQLASMIAESKSILIIGSKVTFQELMQLVQEYENILGRIKKISISEQLLNSHNERLLKTNQQIQLLKNHIQQKENSLKQLNKAINTYKSQLNEIQTKRRLLIDQNFNLEQKIFVKQLDIKHLKGQVMRGVKNNDTKTNNESHKQYGENLNRRDKNVSNERLSQMLNIDVFSGQKKANNKNKKKNYHNQSQSSNHSQDSNQDLEKKSSLTIIEIRKQYKRLNQVIQGTEKQLKTYQRLYKQGMDSLKNICQFLFKLCRDKQTQKLNEEQQIVQQIKQRQGDVKSEKKHAPKKKQSIVHFQDILIDYIKLKGLGNTGEIEEQMKNSGQSSDNQVRNTLSKVSQSSSKSKAQCLKLKTIMSQSFKFNTPTQKLIFNNLFNTLKLANIGPKDQYHFAQFLTTIQCEHVAGQFYYQDLLVNENQEEVMVKQDLLRLITKEKLQLLQQSYVEKLSDLEKHSSSLLIKNIQQNPIKKVQINPPYHQSLIQLQGNAYESSAVTYFSDLQFPLNSWQCEIIDSLIHKKNDFLSIAKLLLQIQTKQKTIYSELLTIRQQRTTCYLNTFNSINIQVNKIYNFLTKGNAQMNLVNSINPFEGIQFSVRPFNKSWKSVNLLSGGQKTLTSLALIFACEEIKKFPFYFMDEIDAALDYRNVTNLGKYIKSKENVQHIVISLRKNMYEQCDQLVCIYKVSDVTRTIVIGMKQLYGRRQDKEKSEEEIIQNSQSNTSTISIVI